MGCCRSTHATITRKTLSESIVGGFPKSGVYTFLGVPITRRVYTWVPLIRQTTLIIGKKLYEATIARDGACNATWGAFWNAKRRQGFRGLVGLGA